MRRKLPFIWEVPQFKAVNPLQDGSVASYSYALSVIAKLRCPGRHIDVIHINNQPSHSNRTNRGRNPLLFKRRLRAGDIFGRCVIANAVAQAAHAYALPKICTLKTRVERAATAMVGPVESKVRSRLASAPPALTCLIEIREVRAGLKASTAFATADYD